MKFQLLIIQLFIIQIFFTKSFQYEYIQLFEELDFVTDTTQFQWKYDSQDFPQLDSKWPLAPTNKFTFWVKLETFTTTEDLWFQLFRLTTTDVDCCNAADRVHAIFIRSQDQQLAIYQEDNSNAADQYWRDNYFCKQKWFFFALNMDYVQTFSSEIYLFGEGTNQNYILIGFKRTIHRAGLPNDLLTQAATKVLVGYDGFQTSGAGKFKDFRFYYENQLSFDSIVEIMGVYSSSYYKSLTVQELTSTVLTETQARDGWTYGSTPVASQPPESPAYISQCNGVYILGGQNVFTTDPTSISKIFQKSSSQVFTQILFTFYFIDSWDDETFTFSVDGAQIQSTTIEGADPVSIRSNICGSFYTDFIGKFNYLLDHQNTEITLSFSANLDGAVDDEAWGLRDLYIITWNFCDASCGTCSGPNSNECTTCRKGNALIAPFNGYCVCPADSYITVDQQCKPCHSTCSQIESDSCNAGDHRYGCKICDSSVFREKVRSRCKCMTGYVEVNGECKNDLPQQLFLMINEIRAADGKRPLFWNNLIYEDIENQGLQSQSHPKTPYYKKLFSFGKIMSFIGGLKLTSNITVEIMRTFWESQPVAINHINGDFQVGAVHLLPKGQKSLLFAHFYHLYEAPSCAKYKENLGDQFQDGIYTLYLASGETVEVYCQDEWMVIQRRTNADLDFNQTWSSYATGFGDLNDDFWLGLENMYKLTIEAKTLQIELWYNNEEYATAEYSGFQIGDSTAYYPLTFDSFVGGNAGNSLETHKGKMFTTYDQDHDDSTGNCGEYFSNGWWFADCFDTNLNGIYSEVSDSQGILYTTWKNIAQSMSQVIMKIK